MKILVTGAAGYIGSFMARRLLDENFEVVIADSLERGHKENIDSRAVFMQGDLKDTSFVESIFSGHSFDAVIHFAAYISMKESMDNPYIYFNNNILASLNILEAMRNHKNNNIIFSSTAGVYGNPITIPIPENHVKHPENPYGESKLMVEKILSWYGQLHNISSVCLRYFNAAGADLEGKFGEDHLPESHIIPNIISSVINNKPFMLYGTDYKTPDGTCIRDYIHVLDLVEAHVLAMKKLQQTPGTFAYNVGTGKGFSNKEVIDMVKKVSGIQVEVTEAPRRPGDADMLIADVTNITNDLGFSPKYSDLGTIVTSAWKWHSRKQK
ncbi:MAG TPA: UDP-glucose 4-epimerase GalE [Patescibacteria group bacterium]